MRKCRVAGSALIVALSILVVGGPVPSADAAPSAASLYRSAIATTNGWRVHYVSRSDTSHVPFLESGDAGPGAGTQSIRIGKAPTLDRASLIVIGDLTFVKGNELAMEDLTGLAPAVAATAMNHWLLFSSNNQTFSQVVVGVRSHDIAEEVALVPPYTMGPSRRLDGYAVDTLYGTTVEQGSKRTAAALYVRAAGRHLLVEEDTLGAQRRPTGAEHIVFSKWGETVRPRAPRASITIGSISAT
jgi:hypothetical protein